MTAITVIRQDSAKRNEGIGSREILQVDTVARNLADLLADPRTQKGIGKCKRSPCHDEEKDHPGGFRRVMEPAGSMPQSIAQQAAGGGRQFYLAHCKIEKEQDECNSDSLGQ